MFAEERDAEEGIFAGCFGVGLLLDGGGRDALPEKEMAIAVVIASAGKEDAGRGVLVKEFSGAVGPFIGATAEDDEDIGLDGAVVDA